MSTECPSLSALSNNFMLFTIDVDQCIFTTTFTSVRAVSIENIGIDILSCMVLFHLLTSLSEVLGVII